jgi:hypothetical protein
MTYSVARVHGLARLELVAFYEDVQQATNAATQMSQRDPQLAYRVFASGGRPVFRAVAGQGAWCRRATDG